MCGNYFGECQKRDVLHLRGNISGKGNPELDFSYNSGPNPGEMLRAL